jgi:antitoxin (DNA-binding transcriptional repressor) of toxin-antitoxin stability system
MSTVSVQGIQRDFLAFIRRIEAGEFLLVLQDGRPLAEVRPVPAPDAQPHPFGLYAGRFTVPSDFDQPLADEVLKEFEGQ